jgi:electron transport complex protein RnfE
MMNQTGMGKIALDGFWYNNPVLVQLLGLCPLLAVTTSTVNGLGMGLATTVVLILSNVTVSLVRNVVRSEIRIAVFVLIIASFVTAVQLAMNAYFHGLYKALGIFIPLIVTNCNIIGRAEAFASKNSVSRSFMDGFTMGLGFTGVLTVLGAMREVVGAGTLFGHADLMFGQGARDMTITVIHHYGGFLLAILPPGAFLGLGLLIAIKNVLDRRAVRRAAQRAQVAAPAVPEAST